jgi:hypothetical protein
MQQDLEKIELAFDLLQDAEIMQEFDDCLWIKVDKDMFNTLMEDSAL